MTMTVKEEGDAFSYTRKAEFEAGEGRQGRRGFGRGNRAPREVKYDASGKETTVDGRRGTTKLKMSKSGETITLKQVRSFEGRNGSMEITTIETWKLSNEGKTLTIESTSETPRGTRDSTMVFTRK